MAAIFDMTRRVTMHDPSNKDLLAEFMEEDEDMEVTVHKRASTVAMVKCRVSPEKS